MRKAKQRERAVIEGIVILVFIWGIAIAVFIARVNPDLIAKILP